MKVSVLCSDAQHPVQPWLRSWAARHAALHDIDVVQRKADMKGGDLLFLVSCQEILSASDRAAYGATLLLHASDLPAGRGWSPHVWQIIEGRNEIVVSLLEADDRVDTGRIWAQRKLQLEGHELASEINDQLFRVEVELLDEALANYGRIEPREQVGTASYYARRSPADSRLDPDKSLAEQFNLLRACDPARFPAYFDFRGHRYIVRLERADGYLK
jgi:methionyl-tRNA formyltransferase